MESMTTEKQRGLGVGFERIRRITGYLVPDLNTWNSGKRAELKDRVVHT
jgi:ribonucleoside-triphosphate reductase